MVMGANSPAPVFSDLPAKLVEDLRKVPGARVVAPEVWRICPTLDGKNLCAGGGATLHEKRRSTVQLIRRDDHDRGINRFRNISTSRAACTSKVAAAGEGGGRFLQIDDVGKPNVLISTKIARDYPNADGTPKKVDDTIRRW